MWDSVLASGSPTLSLLPQGFGHGTIAKLHRTAQLLAHRWSSGSHYNREQRKSECYLYTWCHQAESSHEPRPTFQTQKQHGKYCLWKVFDEQRCSFAPRELLKNHREDCAFPKAKWLFSPHWWWGEDNRQVAGRQFIEAVSCWAVRSKVWNQNEIHVKQHKICQTHKTHNLQNHVLRLDAQWCEDHIFQSIEQIG